MGEDEDEYKAEDGDEIRAEAAEGAAEHAESEDNTKSSEDGTEEWQQGSCLKLYNYISFIFLFILFKKRRREQNATTSF